MKKKRKRTKRGWKTPHHLNLWVGKKKQVNSEIIFIVGYFLTKEREIEGYKEEMTQNRLLINPLLFEPTEAPTAL